jgi:hypothetical protein
MSFDDANLVIGKVTVSFNLLDHNTGDGIELQPLQPTNVPPSAVLFGPLVIGHNLTFRNGGAGVDVAWTQGIPSKIVDDGGNIALFNGATCTGVRCIGDFTSGLSIP